MRNLENLDYLSDALTVLQDRVPDPTIYEPVNSGDRFLGPPQPAYTEQLKTPYLTASRFSDSMAKLDWVEISSAVGYRIRRNGQILDRGNVTSDYIGSLPAGNHKFEVAAYDANGTQSAWSNAVSLNFGAAETPIPPPLPPAAGNTGVVPHKILRLKKPGKHFQPLTEIFPLPSTESVPPPNVADDTIFGLPSTVVYIGGAAIVLGGLYMMSGKK